jgi:hypothetical protein
MKKRSTKRYQVQLTNNHFYKVDGWKNPMISRFNTIEECERNIEKRSLPNMHMRIKDTETGAIIKEVHTEINEQEFGY